MPYIVQKDRAQYDPIINKVLEAIHIEKDALSQVDRFANFAWFLFRGSADSVPFNETDEDIRKQVCDYAWAVLCMLRAKELTVMAGDLNYVLSSIIWGMLGDDPLFDRAKYATRAYMHGVLLTLQDLPFKQDLPSKKVTRKNVMLHGVLGDVMDELYRRRTAIYEDRKIYENGDLWDSPSK
jgi:hypothetical protein